MPPARTTSPGLDDIGDWLKARRERLGWTQKQVVEAVERAGAQLSRGHLSNFESGAYAPSPALTVVLDLVLDGEGALIRLAEEVLEVRIESPMHPDFIGLARTLHEEMPRWAEDAEDAQEAADGAKAPTSPSPAAKRKREQRTGRSAPTIQGREAVESAVRDLLAIAASRSPRDGERIELSGSFKGLRGYPGRGGLPPSIREALRLALESGWKCRHYIQSPPPTGPEAAELVFVAAPLMPCPQYDPLLVARDKVPAVDDFLFIPGVAAVGFQASAATGGIDAAFVHESDGEQAYELLEKLHELKPYSFKFVERRVRQHDPFTPRLTRDELKHRRFLAEAARLTGPARLVVDRWPTSTIPPEDYVAMVERRRDAAARAAEAEEVRTKEGAPTTEVTEAEWDEMKEMQAARFEELRRHLRSGLPYQLIITPSALRLPSRNENNWTGLNLHERERHFEYVRTLLEDENFEIGVASDPWAHRIEKCRWELHDQMPGGEVRLETHFTPGLNKNEWEPGPPKECRVDLRITTPAAIGSFSSYFRQLWLKTEPLTPERLPRKGGS
jgi:transcriptional regulator with XRE-family HTH domain